MLHVRQQSRPLLVVVGHTCSKPLLLVFNPHNPAPSSRSFLLHIDIHCIKKFFFAHVQKVHTWT